MGNILAVLTPSRDLLFAGEIEPPCDNGQGTENSSR